MQTTQVTPGVGGTQVMTVAPGGGTQQGPTVIVAPIANTSIRQNYAHKQSLGLGITQLTIGILCFLFQIVAICVSAGVAVVGHGIWCGIFFILAGSFGIAAAKTKTTCMIVTFMVFSIISAVLTPAMIASSSVGIQNDRYVYHYNYDYVYHHYSSYYSQYETGIAINAILLLLTLTEVVCAIWASVICCAGVCCGNTTQGAVLPAGQVQYLNTTTGGQQVFFVTQPLQQQGMMVTQTQTQPYYVQGSTVVQTGVQPYPVMQGAPPMALTQPQTSGPPPYTTNQPGAYQQPPGAYQQAGAYQQPGQVQSAPEYEALNPTKGPAP